MLEYYLLRVLEEYHYRLSGEGKLSYSDLTKVWEITEYIREIEWEVFDGPEPTAHLLDVLRRQANGEIGPGWTNLIQA